MNSGRGSLVLPTFEEDRMEAQGCKVLSQCHLEACHQTGFEPASAQLTGTIPNQVPLLQLEATPGPHSQPVRSWGLENEAHF